MEHLTKALNKVAKDYVLDPGASFLTVIAQYLVSGDEKRMAQLLKITEPDMNKLVPVALAMPRPARWSDADRRLVHFFIRRSAVLNGPDHGHHHGEPSDRLLGRYLEPHLGQEKSVEDFCSPLHAEAMALGVSEVSWRLMAARHFEPRTVEGRLNSAGRLLVALSSSDLFSLMPAIRYRFGETEFMPAFACEAPDRLEAVMDELLRHKKIDDMPRGGWQAGLKADAARFESRVAAAFELMQDEEEKGDLARALEKQFPRKYSRLTLPAARNIGSGLGGELQAANARWLIEREGVGALPAIADYIRDWNPNNGCIVEWKLMVLAETMKLLGGDSRTLFPLAMQKDLPQLRQGALQLWIDLREPTEDAAIERQLTGELTGDVLPEVLQLFIPLAAAWKVERMAGPLSALLEHKSKPVRAAAAQALGALGDAALPKAAELLAAKKQDARKSGVSLLAAIGTPAALDALKAQLAQETSEDVRDLILKALPRTPPAGASPGAAPAAESLKPDPAQIEAAIAAAAPKIKGSPAAWLDETKLPPLCFADGRPLGPEAVRYLLYRQSREKEMTPDAEGSLLYALLDRSRSGDFALAVLNGYLASALDAKDRWALALAGMLGDDRVVPILSRQIDAWAEAARGKLAEYAVQALALLGSDAALLAVDAMSIRYRTKFKNIGKAASQAFLGAADARGVSAAELGDRVVPWLGFEPGKPRLFEFGDHRIEVGIGLDLKPVWRDLVKGKPIKSLPASAPDPVKAEAKQLTAGLKEAAKAQLLRIESLMVQQNRWTTARWRELFLGHPLLFPFAARLVWGVFDPAGKVTATFRALEDRSLTDAGDEPFALPAEATTGLVHPLDVSAELRQAWLKHCADYNVEPPFAQLGRPVIRATAGQSNTTFGKEVAGTGINAMTFKGRAERLGWSRGSVVDGGGIRQYFKPFPAAGVDVFLEVDGMYVGIDMYADITLGQVFFVRHQSVQMGSYVYDEPADDKDQRLVRFGDVPPIAFSEAMGDVSRISGKGTAPEAAET